MLKALAIIGIVIGSIIVLLLLLLVCILFVPFRYKIGGSNKDELYFYFLLSYFLHFFRIKVYYREKMGWLSVRILGIKFLDKEIPEIYKFLMNLMDKLSKKKEGSEEGSEEVSDENTLPEEETEDYEMTDEEFREYLNGEDELDDMNSVEKNISFLSSLKEFVLNIKKKWYNFKESVKEKIEKWERTKKKIKYIWKLINYPSFKESLMLLKNLGITVVKHVFPRKWRMKIAYGDEDPYLTGKVHSYICMARGLFNREIDFTPVWGENKFELEGYVSGRVQLYVLLRSAFILFTNKHIWRMVKLIRKGGRVRG